MKMTETAEQAGQRIVEAFANPSGLPKPLARILIPRKDDLPCSSWSWRNRLLVTLAGHQDARGFRQWEQVGRRIKSGEKAFYILSLLTTKGEDEQGNEKMFLYGWKGTPVFGMSQTEGKELPPMEEDNAWLNELPLIEVAKRWGIRIEANPGDNPKAWGVFSSTPSGGNQQIVMSCKNIDTWLHELVHAADFRNKKLTKSGWKAETVADLGSSILIELMGLGDEHNDLGGCFKYIQGYAEQNDLTVIEACGVVLDRTCDAVKMILDEAQQIKTLGKVWDGFKIGDRVELDSRVSECLKGYWRSVWTTNCLIP